MGALLIPAEVQVVPPTMVVVEVVEPQEVVPQIIILSLLHLSTQVLHVCHLISHVGFVIKPIILH